MCLSLLEQAAVRDLTHLDVPLTGGRSLVYTRFVIVNGNCDG